MKRYIRSDRTSSKKEVVTITSYKDFMDEYDARVLSSHYDDREKYYLDITDSGYRDIANHTCNPEDTSRDIDKYSSISTSSVEYFLYYARIFASNFEEVKQRLGDVFPMYVDRLNTDLKSEANAAFAEMSVSVARLGMRGVSSVIQKNWITVTIKHSSDYKTKVDKVVDALDSTGLVYAMTVNDTQDYTAIKATWNKEQP